MKHTLITLLAAIYLTGCATIAPAPTDTALPSPTMALTQTPVPTLTLTSTLAAGETLLAVEWKDNPEEIPTIPNMTTQQFFNMIQDQMKGKPERDTSKMIPIDGFAVSGFRHPDGGEGDICCR
jgi:hypothetical protein